MTLAARPFTYIAGDRSKTGRMIGKNLEPDISNIAVDLGMAEKRRTPISRRRRH